MKNKILFILFDLNLGGTEKSLISLLNAIDQKNLKIEVLLMRNYGTLRSLLPQETELTVFPNTIRINYELEVPLPHQIISNFKKWHLATVFTLLLLYIKIRIFRDWSLLYRYVLRDITFNQDYSAAIAYAGPHDFITYTIAKKIKAQKKIQWIHFDIEKVIANFNFGKKYYPFFDKIFCVSQSAKDIFLKHFEQLENKTEVFHNIVSESELKKQAESGEKYEDGFDGIRVLTVGRFTKEKGQHLIPAVAKKLKADKIRFRWYLVGDGKQKAHVEHLVKQMSLENEVVFLGEQLNPYPYMKDCDIYVQPSLHEGFGITVAEAKIFCKPIVVTNFASATDLINDGETGMITNVNAASIANALSALIDDQSLRKQFSMNLEKEQKNTLPKLPSFLTE